MARARRCRTGSKTLPIPRVSRRAARGRRILLPVSSTRPDPENDLRAKPWHVRGTQLARKLKEVFRGTGTIRPERSTRAWTSSRVSARQLKSQSHSRDYYERIIDYISHEHFRRGGWGYGHSLHIVLATSHNYEGETVATRGLRKTERHSGPEPSAARNTPPFDGSHVSWAGQDLGLLV